MNAAESVLRSICDSLDFRIADSVELPSREARFSLPPNQLHEPLKRFVAEHFPNGLYSHQSQALALSIGGSNVCLATATASGKSLVFQLSCLYTLIEDPEAKVLALYPAKALIRDQLSKWKFALASFGEEPAFIDGSTPMDSRATILDSHRVILMTPDVCHAWAMSNLSDPRVRHFFGALRVLVLDEAHVYEGVFGTNMAYFLRRLRALSTCFRMICSTATLGDPRSFMYELTGQDFECLTSADDGSYVPPKSVLSTNNATFDQKARLLAELATSAQGSFIAFAESRKEVEHMVATATRQSLAQKNQDGNDEDEGEYQALFSIRPYRAGYEDSDRSDIQNALSEGTLAGVVSTSALELGLDIGEIRFVIILGTPISVKSFLQRIGRCGRSTAGACLVIDDRGSISILGIDKYLARSVEPNWLYLENRSIQYVNALCAAQESLQFKGDYERSFPFESLPPNTIFRQLLDNELSPSEPVPNDLFHLKQRGEEDPHHEFPLRSGIERQFSVRNRQGSPHSELGTLTFPQLMREAYPGAIYYYMAQPFRVNGIRFRESIISVHRDKYWSTSPIAQTKIFPDLPNGARNIKRSNCGFLAETTLQVSERVIGFSERRGGSEPTRHEYGAGSPYSQRPINRFFETIGVCWSFEPLETRIDTLNHIREAFCLMFGIVERDLGIGDFYSQWNPSGDEPVRGACIYDSAQGGLRLTQKLCDSFSDVLEFAWEIANERDNDASAVMQDLEMLEQFAAGLGHQSPAEEVGHSPSGDWMEIIAPESLAMYRTAYGTQEVKVIGYHPGFQGLMYELEHPEYTWKVPHHTVQAIFGESESILLNVETGEEKLP